MTSMLTIGQMLTTQARLQPDRIGARDRAMTFAAWNARACQLANGLLALGLSKGDRIAVLAYNRLDRPGQSDPVRGCPPIGCALSR